MKKLLAFVVLAGVVGAGAVAGAQGIRRFTDIDGVPWAHEAIGWAADNEITTGTSETTFSPGDTVTRAESVVFLHRYNDMVADLVFGPLVSGRMNQHQDQIATLEGKIDALASCVRGVWSDSSQSDDLAPTFIGYEKGVYTEAEWQTALADQRTVRDEALARCAGVLP